MAYRTEDLFILVFGNHPQREDIAPQIFAPLFLSLDIFDETYVMHFSMSKQVW